MYNNYERDAVRLGVSGTGVVWLQIDLGGIPEKVMVVRALGYGLDQKAVEAVAK